MALKDYHNTGTVSDNQAFNSDRWNAMIFTTTSAYSIESVKLILTKKIAESPGTITVSLREVDDETEKPIEDDLTSGTINGNNLPDSGIAFQEIVFDAPILLDDATKYAICIRSQNGSGTTYYVYIRRASDAYENGHKSYSWDTGVVWYNTLSADYFFETYSVAILPGAPTIVSPAPTGVIDITLDETPLSWNASDPAADTYEIYFRELGDAWVKVGEAQAGITWTVVFGALAYGTTYQWRIDATNADGTTEGAIWSFTCLSFVPPRISYILIPDGSGFGPYDDTPGVEGTDWSWSGENNLLTVRRLVAVAKNAVFYESV